MQATQPRSRGLGFGIETRYLPSTPDNVTDTHAAAFKLLMAELPKPLLGSCRTGRRSTLMWALSRAGNESPARLLEAASQAGYDLDTLAPRLEKNRTGCTCQH
ncbi:hypothetical protein G4G28_09750 [Massilia sp. Dwa41.01b]|nr:hypothetical protein G4G28_09750 [Massilia sp. Dwa41.01b]QNB01416.1 hypothetical protein G4G31_13425 [Massilia sp. Se16.2.3]